MTIPDSSPQSMIYKYSPPERLSSLSLIIIAQDEEQELDRTALNVLDAAVLVADDCEVVIVDLTRTSAVASATAALGEVLGHQRITRVPTPQNIDYESAVRLGCQTASKEWLLLASGPHCWQSAALAELVSLTDGADLVLCLGEGSTFGEPPTEIQTHLAKGEGRPCSASLRRGCLTILARSTSLRSCDFALTLFQGTKALYAGAAAHSLIARESTRTRHSRRFAARILGMHRAHRPPEWRGGSSVVRALSANAQGSRLVGGAALLMGVLATIWTVANQRVLAYGDAEAHLNISKRVVSGLTSGFSQLGSVWLPLPHLLMAPFVVPDSLWRAGIAGAAIGIPSLVLLAVSSYKLALLLTGSRIAAIIAPAVLVLNPNTLYLSATPMTEVLLLALSTASIYFLARWIRSDETKSLIFAALFGCLSTLTRYDGWALVAVQSFVVLLVAWRRYRRRDTVEGTVILYGVIAFAGMAGWFLWNLLIFADPLYFADSVYGAAEQQEFFLSNGLLPTKGDLLKSVLYWLENVRLIVGVGLLVPAAAGLAVVVTRMFQDRWLGNALVVATSLTCFGFYVLSLYAGQAILILPRFVDSSSPYEMFNLRYGVQALLPISLLLASLASLRPRLLTGALLVLIAAHAVASTTAGDVMAFKDGTEGLSSQKVSKGPDSPPVELWMRENYDKGLVLMDDYRRPIGPVESGVPMDRFIGVGNKPYWEESLDNPGKHATWIIVRKAETDAVWAGFSTESRSILEDHFVQVLKSGELFVFKRRPPVGDTDLVVKRGQHLMLNDRWWNPIGVNSFDLLERDAEVIDFRIRGLADSGINAIRTWCFDKDGGVRDETLIKLAGALDTADSVGVKVVCTFTNNHDDFGGKDRFTPPGSDFFTSTEAKRAYQSQVRRILEFRTVSGVRLSDHSGILAWDLINEPRPSDGTPVDAIAEWLEEMAQYVNTLDQRHLVTVGAEGFHSSYPAKREMAGGPGAEFDRLCQVQGITICSGHLYPKYLADPSSSEELGRVLHEWRANADRYNKPVLLGEVGYSLSDPGHSREGRLEFIDNVARAIAHNAIDGGLLWNAGGEVDATFTLVEGDPESDRVIGSWVTFIPRSPEYDRPHSSGG